MAVLVVRGLEPGDSLADLTALLNRAYAALAERGFRYVASYQDEAVTARRVRRGECLVALRDGALAGTITAVPPGRTGGCPYYQRPGLCTLHQFGVEPRFQRQGIGAALLDAAERLARERGAREIALDTAEGARELIATYQRRGYRVAGRVDWESTNYVSIILARQLAEEGPPGGPAS